MRFIKYLSLFCILGILCYSCSDASKAKRTLKQDGLEFSSVDFLHCVHNGDMESVKTFIAAGMSIHVMHNTGVDAFWMASQEGHLDIVKYLLELEADVNFADPEDDTPLMQAALRQHHDVVRFLLESGADPNLINMKLETALTHAIENEDLECIKILVEAGANINLFGEWKESALQTTIEDANIDIINYLLDHGADPDGGDSMGYTPLRTAVYMDNLEIARLLLDKGADPLNKNNLEKESPLDVAIDRGNKKMAALFRKYI